MARIKIEIPEKIHDRLSISVRITDVNYGNHMGNDALVSIIHEARVQWLIKMGYTEMNIEGASIIMSDLAVCYLSESFYGDQLDISIAIGEISSAGFELYYLIETVREEKKITVAKAKTGIVFYDYKSKKIAMVPNDFKTKINS
jgi:acyl-CoA thioester hydrolase